MVINFDRLGQGGGSGSGSTVNWVQEVTGGTEIAKITIDGVEQNVYAPEGAEYEAGENITISGNTISAVDTTYVAGTGIEISGNTINCTVTGSTGGNGFTIVDSADSTGLADATTNIINGTNKKYCVIDNGFPYFIYTYDDSEVQWQAFNRYSNGDGRWTIKYSNSTGHWGHIISSLDSIRLGSTTLNESQLQSLLALIAN